MSAVHHNYRATTLARVLLLMLPRDTPMISDKQISIRAKEFLISYRYPSVLRPPQHDCVNMKHQVYTIVGVMIERYRPQHMESLCYCHTLLLLLRCKYPCVRSMVIDRRQTRREEKWNETSKSAFG